MVIVKALQGLDMLDDPLRETGLDRIGALACSDPLGAALWRVKWAGDPRSFGTALALLVKRVRKPHEARTMVVKLCHAVLQEWLDELCRHCEGRGAMVTPGTPVARHACPVCSGTGVRKPSEQRRAAKLGFAVMTYLRWEPRFRRVELAIRRADAAVWVQVAAQLERDGARRPAAEARTMAEMALHGPGVVAQSDLAVIP